MQKKVEMLLAPMVKTGAEPLGSMGSDVALACTWAPDSGV